MLTMIGLQIDHHQMLHKMAERTNFDLEYVLNRVFPGFHMVSLLNKRNYQRTTIKQFL